MLDTQVVQPRAENTPLSDWQMPGYNPVQNQYSGLMSGLNSPPVPAQPPVKGPPDFVVIDPKDIQNAMSSLATAPDVGMNILKQIPGFGFGLTAAGNALGAAGSAIEQSPLGSPLDAFRQAVTGGAAALAQPVIGAVGSRLGDIGDSLTGKNSAYDPSFFERGLQVAGSLFLGKTGQEAFDFSRNIGPDAFANLGQDLKDSFAIGGTFAALTGAGLAAKALGSAEGLGYGSSSLGQFLNGFTGAAKSLVGSVSTKAAVDDTAAFVIGRAAGQVTLGTSGLGLVGEFALPKIAPNEQWAADLMNNRIINQDSPWRFPFEAATSLPMDLGELAKWGMQSRVGKFMSDIRGDPILSTDVSFGDYQQIGIENGVTTPGKISAKAARDELQLAGKYLVEDANIEARGRGLGTNYQTVRDLPLTDDELRTALNTKLDMMRGPDGMNLEKLAKEAAITAQDAWESVLPGWNKLNKIQQLAIDSAYQDAAAVYEQATGKILMLSDGAKNPALVGLQAPLAFLYLSDMVKGGATGTLSDLAQFLKNYPALTDVAKAWVDGGVFHIDTALNDIRGSFATPDEYLAGLRSEVAQLEKQIRDAPFGPSELVDKRQTILDARREQLATAEEQVKLPRSGNIQFSIDELDKRIASGEKGLSEQRQALTDALAPARERELTDLGKQIDVQQADILAKQDRLAYDTTLTQTERNTLKTELEQMQRDVTAQKQQLGMMTQYGYRWELQYPTGPSIRANDAAARAGDYILGNRTTFGKIWDTLFGGIPSMGVARETSQFITDNLMNKAGMSWDELNEVVRTSDGGEKALGWLAHLRTLVKDSTEYFATGHTRAESSSIYNIKSNELNSSFQRMYPQYLDAAGKIKNVGMTPAELLFRAAPGPWKLALEHMTGKNVPNIPYNSLYQDVTRHYFPMLRYMYSPRFFLMNYLEHSFIGGFLGGLKWLNAPAEPFSGLSQSAMHQTVLPGGIEAGLAWKNLSKSMYVAAPEDVVNASLHVLENSPEMRPFLETLGGRAEIYKNYVDRMAEKQAIISGSAAETKAELAIKAQIDKNIADRGLSSGEVLMKDSKTAELQAKLDKMIVERKFAEVGRAEELGKLDQFQTAVQTEYRQTIADLRSSYYGNPDRSAMERLLNSYMLYWPISYQLKAAKDLYKVMTSQMFGYHTGSLGAVTYQQLRDDIAQNPQAKAFFDNNAQLLGVARQLLPITPEDVGVSLSRFIRVPQEVIQGKKTVSQGIGGVFNLGPIYDQTLAQRVAAEQSKPNSLFGWTVQHGLGLSTGGPALPPAIPSTNVPAVQPAEVPTGPATAGTFSAPRPAAPAYVPIKPPRVNDAAGGSPSPTYTPAGLGSTG